jgi:hypothetical protein
MSKVTRLEPWRNNSCTTSTSSPFALSFFPARLLFVAKTQSSGSRNGVSRNQARDHPLCRALRASGQFETAQPPDRPLPDRDENREGSARRRHCLRTRRDAPSGCKTSIARLRTSVTSQDITEPRRGSLIGNSHRFPQRVNECEAVARSLHGAGSSIRRPNAKWIHKITNLCIRSRKQGTVVQFGFRKSDFDSRSYLR